MTTSTKVSITKINSLTETESTTTTTTRNSIQSMNDVLVAVCHSGHVHVRGKIRRVWRQRYFELMECNGHLRYYDSSTIDTITNSNTDQHGVTNDHQNESFGQPGQQQQQQRSEKHDGSSLKCTLVIQPGTVRILDATTLRDMHVGLPRGSYGFVFGAKRILSNTSIPIGTTGLDNNNINRNEIIAPQQPDSPLPYRDDDNDHGFVYAEDVSTNNIDSEASASDHLTLLSSSTTTVRQHNLNVGSCRPSFTQHQHQHQQEQSQLDDGRNSSGQLQLSEPRDYLCSVATLEEAQMWVVALKWAALPPSFRQKQSSSTTTVANFRGSGGGTSNSATLWWAAPTTTTATVASSPSTMPTSSSSVRGKYRNNTNHSSDTRPLATSSNQSTRTSKNSTTDLNVNNNSNNLLPSTSQSAFYYPPPTSPSDKNETVDVQTPNVVDSHNAHPSPAIIPTSTRLITDNNQIQSHIPNTNTTGMSIVSKVVKYRTVRINPSDVQTTTQMKSSWHFEIAYEIHCLIVHRTDQSNITSTATATTTTTTTQQHDDTATPIVVEKWSMLRTAADFERLIQNLCKELGPSLLDRAQLGPMKQLPRWKNRPTPTELFNSISVVDSILRSLVMDVDMVHADAMKIFLGLSNTSGVQKRTTQRQIPKFISMCVGTIWNIHNPESVVKHSYEVMPTNVDVNDYVKCWLLKKAKLASFEKVDVATYFIQRPLWLAGGIGFTSIAIVPLASFFGTRYTSMPVITMRIDVLVFTWMGAAYMGNKLLGTNFATITSNDNENVATISFNNSETSKNSGFFNSLRFKKVDVQARRTKTVNINNRSSRTLTTTNRDPTKRLSSTVPDGPIPTTSSVSTKATDEGEMINVPTGFEHIDNEDESVMFPADSFGSAETVDAGMNHEIDDGQSSSSEEEEEDGETNEEEDIQVSDATLSDKLQSTSNFAELSPLPKYDFDNTDRQTTRWSQPVHNNGSQDVTNSKDCVTFYVRGVNYLRDRIKIPSGPPALRCRGIDMWLTDNPERNIARHPAMLGGKLHDDDTFLVNFLLPFGNFVAYFSVPPLNEFPNDKLRSVWTKFLNGDQQYRDARLKLLPVVVEGPWIVKTAVGPGKSPALLGKVIPLQYFFRAPTSTTKGIYEVDVIITASTIAKGILSVVKGHTKSVSLAFAFIIEASEEEDLPETVLCSCQIHSIHIEHCPTLPQINLDEDDEEDEDDH